jgi:hypothetical protein
MEQETFQNEDFNFGLPKEKSVQTSGVENTHPNDIVLVFNLVMIVHKTTIHTKCAIVYIYDDN